MRGRIGRLIASLIAVALMPWTPAQAVPCPNCFAVFAVPDTQVYTADDFQPEGGAHFDLIMRWVCAHAASWTEPATGKQMPILITLGLGDIVQGSLKVSQWAMADAAHDVLDACGMPYIAVMGNHDIPGTRNIYHGAASLWNTHFGLARYSSYFCTDELDCDLDAGNWFIGTSQPLIGANSRNNADLDPGPPAAEDGRHRLAIVAAPNGQKWLFMGLDLDLDFPPLDPGNTDDIAWLNTVFDAYPGVHTVVVHHAIIESNVGDLYGNIFGGDSSEAAGGVGVAIWNEIMAPNPQVLMSFNGHFTALGARENLRVETNDAGDTTWLYIANYQGDPQVPSSYGDGGQVAKGDGWNVITVFDPDAGEIRIRSYRIEDTDDDGTHDGVPQTTALLDMDFEDPPITLSYAFPDARPASEDNCPGVSNPDQADFDGNGVGDACEPGGVPALGRLALALTAGILATAGSLRLRRRFLPG